MKDHLILTVIAALAALLINGYAIAGDEIASSEGIIKHQKISFKPYGWFEDIIERFQ